MNTSTTTTITNTATKIIITTINSMITTTLGGSSGGCSSLQPPILHGECSPKGACLNEVTSGRGDEKNKIIYIYIYVYVYISNQTKQRSTKTRYNNKYVYKAYKTRRNTHIYIYIYKFIVHFIKKRTTARADPQPPLQPTHRQRKTFRPLLVAPLKLRKGRNVLPSCVLVATGCCVPQPHNLGG